MSANIEDLRKSILALIKDNDYEFDDIMAFVSPLNNYIKNSNFLNYIVQIVEEIIKHGKVKKAWLGNFSFRNIVYRDKTGQQLRALQVIGDDLSIENGLRDEDIIISIKGSEPLWSTLRASINSLSPGDILELIVIRNNERVSLDLKTVERPERI